MPHSVKTPLGERKLERELEHAGTYAEWLQVAIELDRLSGALDWRASDESDLLHVPEIRRSIAHLRGLREAGESWDLMNKFQEVLFRHQGEFVQAELYQSARSGTKLVVKEFFDELEACLRYLVAIEVEGVTDEYRLEQIKRVGRVYGRPALLLSGGAVLGLYHFGVIKALFEEDLLPRTISGSSMGAILASWACSHTDDELRALFANLSLINTDALGRLPTREMLRQRTVMDQRKLLNFLGTVIPDLTFKESMRHSKRIVNVTVSPLSTRQTPRLLNYLSSPDVLLHPAVLASCAVPLLFKPVQLTARQRGEVKPWMDNELWVDGSVSGDLPFNRLTQMLNINHYITSQANPHIVPFLSLQGEGGGVLPAITRAGTNLTLRGSSELLALARRVAPGGLLRDTLDTAHAMTNQIYAGSDMHIQLPFQPLRYTALLTSPSFKEFKEYVRLGEQATWPRIEMIRDRTRISRLFGTCIGMLMQRIAAKDTPVAASPGTAKKAPASPRR